MKKNLPYIILFFLCLVLAFFIYLRRSQRVMDNEVTYRRVDKKPYGMFVAFQGLKNLYPNSSVTTTHQEPGYWDSLSEYEDGQALVIVADNFSATNTELKKLMDFVKEGNDLFIAARMISPAAQKYFNCKIITGNFFNFPINKGLYDSLQLTLEQPPFAAPIEYIYPGRGVHSYFADYNAPKTEVLGLDAKKRPYFIRLQAGRGNIFIHVAPIALSNYFLLHKNNYHYFEKVFSMLNPDVKRIVWDEYYLLKKEKEGRAKSKSGWWSVLMQYKAMKAALLTAIFALLAYVLSEMRRKQRIIPVVKKPKNESLDFVKTIGRLYYDKSDHLNLCKKMSAFFLEHVRNRYKLQTNQLNQEFIQDLHQKTNISEEDIGQIVTFIQKIETSQSVSAQDVIQFHQQLESFYKKG